MSSLVMKRDLCAVVTPRCRRDVAQFTAEDFAIAQIDLKEMRVHVISQDRSLLTACPCYVPLLLTTHMYY